MFYFYLASFLFILLSSLSIAFWLYERQQLREFLNTLDLLYEKPDLPWQNKTLFILKEHQALANKFAEYYLKMGKLQNEYSQALQDEKRMIASIAHDFQTPLTTILGTIELLENENTSKDKQAESKSLTTSLNLIKERTLSLSNQVKSFYLYSIIDSGDKSTDIKELKLYDLLANEIAARAKDIEAKFKDKVRIDLDENLAPLMQDELGCQRIIANLLKNCLEHGEEELTISLKSNFNHQILTFSNIWYNPGISDLNLICKRSYRADSARKLDVVNAHAGLGMSIVNDLAERLQIKLLIHEENYKKAESNNENNSKHMPDNSALNKLQPHKAKLFIKLIFSNYQKK